MHGTQVILLAFLIQLLFGLLHFIQVGDTEQEELPAPVLRARTEKQLKRVLLPWLQSEHLCTLTEREQHPVRLQVYQVCEDTGGKVTGFLLLHDCHDIVRAMLNPRLAHFQSRGLIRVNQVVEIHRTSGQVSSLVLVSDVFDLPLLLMFLLRRRYASLTLQTSGVQSVACSPSPPALSRIYHHSREPPPRRPSSQSHSRPPYLREEGT